MQSEVRRIDARTSSGILAAGRLPEPLGLRRSGSVLPAEENYRVATIHTAKLASTSRRTDFYRDLATPGTIQRRKLSLRRADSISISGMNTPGKSRPVAGLLRRNRQRPIPRKILRASRERRMN